MSWRELTVALDRTHHRRGPAAAYDARFDEVLPFHEPGLAPVLRDRRAWHIRDDGSAAYEGRLLRTFGFYEGRAAVTGEDGCGFILPDGSALAQERHAWCGNFQGGRCTVRGLDARYFHVDREGRSAYPARWRYAGDFREDAAVVQRDDGRCTHIDRDGSLVHGEWFCSPRRLRRVRVCAHRLVELQDVSIVNAPEPSMGSTVIDA